MLRLEQLPDQPGLLRICVSHFQKFLEIPVFDIKGSGSLQDVVKDLENLF